MSGPNSTEEDGAGEWTDISALVDSVTGSMQLGEMLHVDEFCLHGKHKHTLLSCLRQTDHSVCSPPSLPAFIY